MINLIVIIITMIASIIGVFCSAYIQNYILVVLSAFGYFINSVVLVECINLLREKRNKRGRKE